MPTETIESGVEQFVERMQLSAGSRVDRENGVIHGVKLLGLESRNGRTYLPEAVQAARHLYEGVRVNVDHPKGAPNSARGYADRIGAVKNVEYRNGLYGDLHYNPKHALAEQLAWDAERAPANVGLSHNIEAKSRRDKNGKTIIESITRVASVDLVADPATTSGLYEHVECAAIEPEEFDGRTFAERYLGRGPAMSAAEIERYFDGPSESPEEIAAYVRRCRS